MATLALLQLSASNGSPIQMESWSIAEPQGAEDKQLRDNAHFAVEHWRSRAEYLLATQPGNESYVSVPFKPVKKVRVTYRHVGALKTVPYPLDE
jgi:hypothetical protein